MYNDIGAEESINEDPEIEQLIDGIEDVNEEYEQRQIQERAINSKYRADLLMAQLKEIQENIDLKKMYTKIFIKIMIDELMFINIIVLLQGFDVMQLDKSIFNVFLIGVFTQIVSIVVIIFNNIFPKDHDKNIIEFHKKLFTNNSSQ